MKNLTAQNPTQIRQVLGVVGCIHSLQNLNQFLAKSVTLSYLYIFF